MRDHGTAATNSPLEEKVITQIYVARGGDHGRDMGDWFEAERQLVAEFLHSKPAATRTPSELPDEDEIDGQGHGGEGSAKLGAHR